MMLRFICLGNHDDDDDLGIFLEFWFNFDGSEWH